MKKLLLMVSLLASGCSDEKAPTGLQEPILISGDFVLIGGYNGSTHAEGKIYNPNDTMLRNVKVSWAVTVGDEIFTEFNALPPKATLDFKTNATTFTPMGAPRITWEK